MLVLAAIVATPAFSVAQDTGTTTSSDPSLLPEPPRETEPPVAEPPPAGDSDQSSDPAQTEQTVTAEPAPARVPTSAGGAVAHTSASTTVSMGDNFYSPASISIAVGDTVTWSNNGQAPHSATADNGSFDTGVFNGGQSRSHTFNGAGTFTYFCTVHANMHGTVRVLAASGGGKGGGGSGRSSGAGTSEAAAVASPNAAGTGTSLADTGFETVGLAAIGLALLAGGVALRRRAGLGYRPPLL